MDHPNSVDLEHFPRIGICASPVTTLPLFLKYGDRWRTNAEVAAKPHNIPASRGVDVRSPAVALAVSERIDLGKYQDLLSVYTEYNIGNYRRSFTLSNVVDREKITASHGTTENLRLMSRALNAALNTLRLGGTEPAVPQTSTFMCARRECAALDSGFPAARRCALIRSNT
ncbi:MAG TPA: Hsp20/alpha crystallin family protein [Methyloceanibacter sp.]